MMDSFRFITTHCPFCGEKLDSGFTPMKEGHYPHDGDVSICIYCLNICSYSVDQAGKVISVVKPSPELMQEYRDSKETWDQVTGMIEFIKKWKTNHPL